MLSAVQQAAAPVAGAARPRPRWQPRTVQERRTYADREREGMEVEVFGGSQLSIATAFYNVEWRTEYGPAPDDYRGYKVPDVQLVDLVAASGASIKNAAGRAQCRRITEQLEEYEYEGGPPEPYRPSFHYD